MDTATAASTILTREAIIERWATTKDLMGSARVPEWRRYAEKVIWATDGSPTMQSEYPVAKDIAESSGAKLIVAHAGEMVSSDQTGIFVDSTETLQAILERTVNDLKSAGLDAELALVKASQSNSAQRIADFAHDGRADLVVVGTRGQGPVAAIFLGSFTFRLLQVAPCPVLVVPTGRQRAA